MYEMVPGVEVWLAICVPILGLSSVFLARCTEHSSLFWPQKFMFLQIFVVGAATLASLANGGSLWAVYGAALALMAVGATVEFTPRRNISF